jgi:hypothetical protein
MEMEIEVEARKEGNLQNMNHVVIAGKMAIVKETVLRNKMMIIEIFQIKAPVEMKGGINPTMKLVPVTDSQ